MKALLWDGLRLVRSMSVPGDWPPSYRVPKAPTPLYYSSGSDLDLNAPITITDELYIQFRHGGEARMHYRKVG